MKSINLNSTIKVKLTPYGADIFYHRFDGLRETLKSKGLNPIVPQMPSVDEDGFTKFQLWDFINIYGDYMGLARKNVIEPIEIYMDEDDLEVH